MKPMYLSLHYHLVLCSRRDELTSSLRVQVQEYLGALVRKFGGKSHGVGGEGDEIHLLVSLRPTQCLAEFVKNFKRGSAAWIKRSCGVRSFAWQRGYSALTMDIAGTAAVSRFLAVSKKRTRKMSLREEFS